MKEKYLYYLTSFLCGLCVMGVEMGATRLLSPYFGSTNLIWTVIICLIMLGLGCGNYLGGRLADKHQNATALYGCIAVGGVFVALIPLISRPVISGGLLIADTMGSQNGFLLAAIAACAILFVPPIILLGMVSPYLAKLCVSDLSHTGVTLGRLQVISTAGSIIGSVLPAFVLIPLIGTKLSFAFFAALLLLPCLLYWLSAKKRKMAAVSTLCLLLAVSSAFYAGSAIAPGYSLYETESSYQYLRVQQFSGYRTLSTGLNTYAQSIRREGGANKLTYTYLDTLATLPALTKSDEPATMLVIGYGGGVLSPLVTNQYDNVDCVFVEIDPAMVEVAREYFGANPNDKVFLDDGRRFLQATGERYNAIAIDAYHDTSIPLNLVTREFFALCAQKLRPGGACAINIAMAANGDNAFCRALGETMNQAFPYVLFVPSAVGTNAVFIGSDVPLPFEQALAQYDESWLLWAELDYMRQSAAPAPRGGSIMTDDRSNAELLQLEAYSLTAY